MLFVEPKTIRYSFFRSASRLQQMVTVYTPSLAFEQPGPRLCREYKMSTLLHNFDFSPTPWGKLHCYNPHRYSPIVYLEDVHKVVFIVIIIISYWWKNGTISNGIAWLICSTQNKQKQAENCWWHASNGKITEIMRNADPKCL